MTAIAAVLALSSTSLFAQSADTGAAGSTAPVLVTPTVVAPSAAAPAAAASPQVATLPILNIPPVTMDTAPPAPQATVAAEPTETTVARVKEVTAPAPKPARVAAASNPAPRAAVAAPAAPATPSVKAQQDVAPESTAIDKPLANPARAAKAPTAQMESSDDMLPIAGMAGIGALALVGGAFAVSRRKRRDKDVDAVPETLAAVSVEPTPVERTHVRPAERAFFFVDMNRSAPPEDGPRTAVPYGFDMSRYGRHAQAAYRGPTADNPSLSLKRRLKRASFFDQRERMATAPNAAQVETRAEPMTVNAEMAMASRTTDQVVSRFSRKPKPNFRPAFQR
jgi:hypothetical protein